MLYCHVKSYKIRSYTNRKSNELYLRRNQQEIRSPNFFYRLLCFERLNCFLNEMQSSKQGINTIQHPSTLFQRKENFDGKWRIMNESR